MSLGLSKVAAELWRRQEARARWDRCGLRAQMIRWDVVNVHVVARQTRLGSVKEQARARAKDASSLDVPCVGGSG